jgi:hypothetical protein
VHPSLKDGSFCFKSAESGLLQLEPRKYCSLFSSARRRMLRRSFEEQVLDIEHLPSAVEQPSDKDDSYRKGTTKCLHCFVTSHRSIQLFTHPSR